MMRTTLGAIVLCASASAATLEITGECHAWQPLPGSSELTLLHSSEDPSCRPYAPGFIMYWFERRLKLDTLGTIIGVTLRADDMLNPLNPIGITGFMDIRYTDSITVVAQGGTGAGSWHWRYFFCMDGFVGYGGAYFENTIEGVGPLEGTGCAVDSTFLIPFVFGEPFRLAFTSRFKFFSPEPQTWGGLTGIFSAWPFEIRDADGDVIAGATVQAVPEPITYVTVAIALMGAYCWRRMSRPRPTSSHTS
jgi:hypothetical protein